MDLSNREEANIVEGDQPWLIRNLIPMIGVAALVAAVIIGVLAWNLRQSARELEARMAFTKATTPEKQVEVAREYLGTEEAALALMQAAAGEYENRNYEPSLNAYNLFLDTYPKHPLTAGVYLGRAYSQLALGETDAAKASLQQASQDKESVYRPVAMLELAHLYGRSGDAAKQLELLNQVSEAYATSRYGQQAIMEMAEINATTTSPQEDDAAATPEEETAEASATDGGS
ncbi:MAG: tetratricopeptide repeat protein [Verrucomicrobiota bacterium]